MAPPTITTQRGVAMPAIERADRRPARRRAACHAIQRLVHTTADLGAKRDLHQRHDDQHQRAHASDAGCQALAPGRGRVVRVGEERVERGIEQQRHDHERDQQVDASRSTPRARAARRRRRAIPESPTSRNAATVGQRIARRRGDDAATPTTSVARISKPTVTPSSRLRYSVHISVGLNCDGIEAAGNSAADAGGIHDPKQRGQSGHPSPAPDARTSPPTRIRKIGRRRRP